MYSCAYACTGQCAHLSGEVFVIIDAEYAWIVDTNTKLVTNMFSIVTPTKNVD